MRTASFAFEIIDGKVECHKCGRQLPVECYPKSKDGRPARPCRECRNEDTKRWREKNPEKVKAMKKRYTQRHRKEISARSARYKAKAAEWKANNKHRYAEYAKRYKAYQKRWRQEHKVHLCLKAAERRVLFKLMAQGKINIDALLEDKICGICGKPIDGEFHIDHIIPLSKGGLHTQENLQLAHPSCNMSKGAKIL